MAWREAESSKPVSERRFIKRSAALNSQFDLPSERTLWSLKSKFTRATNNKNMANLFEFFKKEVSMNTFSGEELTQAAVQTGTVKTESSVFIQYLDQLYVQCYVQTRDSEAQVIQSFRCDPAGERCTGTQLKLKFRDTRKCQELILWINSVYDLIYQPYVFTAVEQLCKMHLVKTNKQSKVVRVRVGQMAIGELCKLFIQYKNWTFVIAA